MEPNYSETEMKPLSKIALVHKIYGWIVIVLSLLAAILVQGPYSFVSLLTAYGMGEISKLFTIGILVASMIAFLFALFNLVIAKALKKRYRYAIYMSAFAILFMVFLRGTFLDYLFAGLLLVLWIYYFKTVKYPSVSYTKFFLYVLPAPALVGAYFLFTMSIHKKAEDLCYTVMMAHSSDVNYVKKKLDSGLDPTLEDSEGRTALFCTTSPALLNLLLDHGADINHQDNNGDTALYNDFAILQFEMTPVKKIETLLAHHPDITLKNNQGFTAVDVARQKYEASLNNKSSSEETRSRLKKIYDLLSSYAKTAKGITNQSSQSQSASGS